MMIDARQLHVRRSYYGLLCGTTYITVAKYRYANR